VRLLQAKQTERRVGDAEGQARTAVRVQRWLLKRCSNWPSDTESAVLSFSSRVSIRILYHSDSCLSSGKQRNREREREREIKKERVVHVQGDIFANQLRDWCYSKHFSVCCWCVCSVTMADRSFNFRRAENVLSVNVDVCNVAASCVQCHSFERFTEYECDQMHFVFGACMR